MAGATTYQDGTDIKFTFRPTLSVALSSEGITISDLTPGQSGVSSPVDVTVNTNNIYGYTMNATVGSSTKNYRELKHANGTDQFASVAVGSGLAAMPTDGGSVWGFASSKDGGQTWSKYTGLPKYDDANNVLELNHASAAAGGDVTKVRIGAYAVTEQVAGDYTNVINFAVVTNVVPVTYMQQMTYASCPTDGVVVYDARDEKAYRVRKITTGGDTLCWMTDNLDLAGGTALYSDGSNVPEGYLATSGDAYYTLPGSSTDGFSGDSVAYVYNSDSKNCGDGSPCYSYYSYAAATAGANPSAGAATSDICPKGWRLPTNAEYTALKNTYTTGAALIAAPFYGVYAGDYISSSFYNGGSRGYYWSSTADNASYAYYLYFDSLSADPSSYNKRYGFSVRCVMRNPNAYNVSYDKNTADTVTDMPGAQVGDTANATITIPATVPTRDGYNFLGWCNAATTTTNGTDSCSGTTYNPNGGGTNRTIVLTPSTTTTVTLHAMWQRIQYTVTIALAGGASGVTIDNTGYTTSATLVPGSYTISGSYNSGYEFDSWATSGSISVASASSASTTLTVSGAGTLTLNGKNSKLFFQNATSAQCGQIMYDNRGTDAYKNIAYTTASINGLCWMTRNLDLPGGTTLTPSDSNVASNYTLPASRTSTNGGVTLDGGFDNNAVADVYNSGSTTCASGSPCYSYYSYAAATAGTNPSSGEAASDICPKGWRLPTNAEYIALKNTYTTGATLTASPWYGVYAGSYLNSSFNDGGSRGYYWSSTARNASYAYYLYLDSSLANTYNRSKIYGFLVRCVLQASDISQISTMQDFATNNASAIKNSMAEGQQYTLTDSRDSKSYTVAKIGNNVWMTKNLDLAGGTTLTAADSNVSAGCNLGGTNNCTLPASSTSGFSDNATAYVYNSNSTTCASNSPCYSYYSYVAATAGTNPEDFDEEATSDICPKGWRLPTRAEFNTLASTYTTGATLTAAPFYGVYAGSYSNSSFYDGGSYGLYWSSNAGNAWNACYLYFGSSSSATTSYVSKLRGYSVRCVAK